VCSALRERIRPRDPRTAVAGAGFVREHLAGQSGARRCRSGAGVGVGAGPQSLRRFDVERCRAHRRRGMSNSTLDVRGLKCPLPIVKAKQALDALAPGDLLEVRATDAGSVPDFQGWARTSKLAILREQRTESDGGSGTVYVHVLERAG